MREDGIYLVRSHLMYDIRGSKFQDCSRPDHVSALDGRRTRLSGSGGGTLRQFAYPKRKSGVAGKHDLDIPSLHRISNFEQNASVSSCGIVEEFIPQVMSQGYSLNVPRPSSTRPGSSGCLRLA